MKSNRKYTETLPLAKKLFKLKTELDYDKVNHTDEAAIKIFKLKKKFFEGTYFEWLNL